MWLDTELARLAALYGKIDTPELETLIPTEDLQCIEDLSSTELAALRNYLFVPKVILIFEIITKTYQHKLDWKTIRFTRLVEPDFNVGTWLKTILKQIRYNDLVVIHVGFSFVAQNKHQKIYLFCPKVLASYTAKCIDKNEAFDFADKLENMSPAEHLQNTFVTSTDTGDPFDQSGYCPVNLVCSYIWITK